MEFIITIAIVLIALGVLFFGGAIYAFARHKKGHQGRSVQWQL